MKKTKQKAIITLSTLLVLVIVTLVFYLFQRTFHPSPEKIPQVSSQDSPLSTNIIVNMNVTFPKLPQGLPVYSFTMLSSEDFAEHLAKTFNLSPLNSNNWTNETQTEIISHDKYNNIVTYIAIPDTPNTINGAFDEEKIVKATNDFLSKASLSNINFDTKEFQYLNDHPEPLPTAKQDASYVKVTLTQHLNEYPLRYFNLPPDGAYILLDLNHKVVKAILPPLPQNFVIEKKYQVIAQKDLENNLSQGKGVVISTGVTGPSLLEAGQINKLNITKLQLEYRILPDENLVWPYFTIEGTAQEKNVSDKILLISSAI